MTQYSCHGALLGSLSSCNLPPLFSNTIPLTPFSPSVWILLFLPDKQTALSSLGKCENKNAGFVLYVKNNNNEKQDPGTLSCSRKCHPGPAINHMGLWCVYLLQWGASLSSTLLFTPLALCTSSKHTSISAILLSRSSLSPFLSLCLSYSLQKVGVYQSLHTYNPKHLFEITHSTIFCLKKSYLANTFKHQPVKCKAYTYNTPTTICCH